MKKFIFLTLSFALLGLFLSDSAQALTFSPDDSYQMAEFVETQEGNLNSKTDTAGPGVTYNFTLTSTGWGDVQISDPWQPTTNNFNAYNSYGMYFTNPSTNTDKFSVEMFLNTGWTDNPPGEPDNRYSSSWVYDIAPGETKYISVDLTNAINLNHVTHIGFKIGANVNGDGDYTFDVQASSVPLPPSVLLLGSGLLGLGLLGFRRRRN